MTWNIFYLQQIYRNDQKRYATSIQELSKLYPEIMNERKNYDIVFSNSNNFYRIEIKSKTQPKLKTTIDSRGNIYF